MQRDGLRAGALALEHGGGPRMPEPALARGQAAVERTGHQRVHERVRAALALDQPGRLQPIGEQRGVGRIQPGQLAGVPQRRAAAEDGEGASERLRAVGQARELALDRARDLLGPEAAQRGADLLGGLDVLGGEVAQERAEQERVAGRGRVARVRERPVGRREPAAHERLGRRRSQRRRMDRGLRGDGEQLRQEVGMRRWLAHAHGAQDPEPQLGRLARELDQPAQRRGIGPVRVVDDEQGGGALRQVAREPRQAVDGRVHRVPGERGLRGVEVERAPRQRGRADRELVPLRRAADGGEQLPCDPPGGVVLERTAPRPQRADVLRHRRCGDGRQQARLPDPRWALHDDHPALARPYAVELPAERCQLDVALQQHAGHRCDRTPGRCSCPAQKIVVVPTMRARAACGQDRSAG
ncbi:MAG: hypothetical protein U0S48_16060 [Solirubrobacteraceae bacterium]